MPDHKTKRIKVTFDKTELRARLHKFTYREARRHAGNLYKALVQELLEDGCLTSAKYFDKLSSKEMELYSNTVIRDRVVDYPHLLMSLYDNCKMAERSAMLEQCEGMTVTFNLLHQLMSLLEQPQYALKFNWLLKDIYAVIVKICDKIGTGKSNVDKPISQIYLKYANHLVNESDNMSLALQYYEKSLALVQTNKWISDTINRTTHTFSYIHEIVVHNYVEGLLKFGTTSAPIDHLRAVELGHKALCALTRVGPKCQNLHHFANANLHMAEFYMEGADYKMANKVLRALVDDMPNISQQHVEKLELRLYMDRGICFTHLNENEKAMECLRKALELSQKLEVKTSEAEAYMYIGKLYLHAGAKQRVLARNALVNSTKVYQDLGDMKGRKKNIYLLAQNMNATVFPLFLDLMKRSEKYCDFFYLRRWKNQLNPFWHGQYLRDGAKLQHNGISCLLDEFVVKGKIKELLKI